jgi:hypothetical protein
MSLCTCDICGAMVRCVAKLDGQWACIDHFGPVPCEKCAEPAKPVGIGQYMILSAGSSEYKLEQNVGYRCANRHLTLGTVHKGPGFREELQR